MSGFSVCRAAASARGHSAEHRSEPARTRRWARASNAFTSTREAPTGHRGSMPSWRSRTRTEGSAIVLFQKFPNGRVDLRQGVTDLAPKSCADLLVDQADRPFHQRLVPWAAYPLGHDDYTVGASEILKHRI
jgi:hypothetical protein